jgi:hypothetical protein
MKKLFLVVMLGVFSAAPFTILPESQPKSPAKEQCKYTLDNAKAGLSGLVVTNFVVRKQSEDGNRQMGFVLYHDPKSANPDSVEAAVLVLRDKRAPDKELTLLVSYNQGEQIVTFKRQLTDDGKSITDCFEKEVEAVKKAP